MVYLNRIFLLGLLLLSGCASVPLDEARSQFHRGQPAQAAVTLENADDVSNRDKLLLYMERGSVLHYLGEYEKSSKSLLQASALMESQDIVSVSEQAGTLLANDWLARYKGEYSERLWVHSYQMMNFLLLGKFESAAVEARQSLQVLSKYGDSLEKDEFTRALIGLSFESVGKYDDARIEYEKLDNPEPFLNRTFSEREIVVFASSGAIPRKHSGTVLLDFGTRVAFPHYELHSSWNPSFRVRVDGQEKYADVVSTTLGEVAQDSLSARGKVVFAKSVARVSAKHALVKDLKESNQAAGEILNGLFFLLEEADTRSWSTLPASLSVLKLSLPSGVSNVTINGKALKGSLTDDRSLDMSERAYRSLSF